MPNMRHNGLRSARLPPITESPSPPGGLEKSMRSRLVLAGLAATTLVAAPSAMGVDARPLPSRNGVVVAWQAASKTAVVVTTNRRVYTVHSLRRVRPGTRVRVDGIKWGAPTSGIKWSVAPRGIKWGIRFARNGTYQSRLTTLGGATTTSLRGKVVRRYGRRAVAVGIRGATVILPLTRGAVWLPSGKVQKSRAPLGAFGSTVVVRLGFARGRAVARGVTQIAPPVSSAPVPVSGRIVAASAMSRSLTVRAGTVAFPLDVTIAIPPAVDIGLYPVGSVLASQIITATDGSLRPVELSLNGSFGQADSATTSVTVDPTTAGTTPTPPPPGGGGSPPAPGPDVIAMATSLKDQWITAHTNGLIPGNGLYTSNRNRLERIEVLVTAGNAAEAILELDAFTARLDAGTTGEIDPIFKAQIAVDAAALRARLVNG